jgi:hypothetical protein
VSLASLLADQVVIVHPAAGSDAYGNPVPDWDAATRTTVAAAVQPAGGSELTADRDTLESCWLLVLPAGTAIAGHDRVEWRGTTFQGRRAAGAVVDPPRAAHVEVRLRLVQ